MSPPSGAPTEDEQGRGGALVPSTWGSRPRLLSVAAPRLKAAGVPSFLGRLWAQPNLRGSKQVVLASSRPTLHQPRAADPPAARSRPARSDLGQERSEAIG